MKVYFSYAICSDYLCMFLVTIYIFHRFVNERPETRCEKNCSFVWTQVSLLFA